jgi:uracil phosphoribosyltransferase
MKILDVRWFNDVGIVRVEDEYDGIKYYIGAIDTHLNYGNSEEYDKERIADWGVKFPNDAGDVLFGVK